MVNIEVAYATPDEQVIVELALPEDATVAAAINASGLLARFPEIASTGLNVGIFGVVCKPDQIVREGDRAEIYRGLVRDPKEARRNRALRRF